MNKVEAYMSDITGKVYATKDDCEYEERRYHDLEQFVDKFGNDSSRHFSFFVSNIGDNANSL